MNDPDSKLTIQELRPDTDAGYVTALCGNTTTMPGLPWRTPLTSMPTATSQGSVDDD